jgi:hypothetical protein
MTQGALLFTVQPQSADADAERLMRALREAGGWRTRVVLQRSVLFHLWDDRRFRAAAAASKGQILGGNKGYCLADFATKEDARQARARLAHQIEDMKQRLIEIDRVFHGRI